LFKSGATKQDGGPDDLIEESHFSSSERNFPPDEEKRNGILRIYNLHSFHFIRS
jgi:hypothetical protein